MENTWVDFRAVKSSVTMEMVLGRYGVKLRRTGKELRGKCPIHQGEGTNTFHANTEKNIFQCFSGACKAKGNVLDFVAAMEKCTVREAAGRLQDWFLLATEKTRGEPAVKSAGAVDESGGDEIEINPPLTFQLKNIDHHHPYLAERGIKLEIAQDFGIGFYSGRGSMTGRIVIPIRDERGELVAYVGRSIDGTEPRYKFPAGFKKSHVLFNLDHALELSSTDAVVVVEGNFDCLKLTQADHVCVALMGSDLSPQQEQLLLKHFGRIVIMLDGDDAGRAGADQCLLRLGRHAWVRAITLPDGTQPDQMSSEQLAEVLRGI